MPTPWPDKQKLAGCRAAARLAAADVRSAVRALARGKCALAEVRRESAVASFALAARLCRPCGAAELERVREQLLQAAELRPKVAGCLRGGA